MLELIQQIRWRPQIGDPSFMGWFTVFAYAAVALLAACCAMSTSRLWAFVAALLALLCVNKQLDLQSLLTEVGRIVSVQQGWYEERRAFQKWLVLGILAGSALSTGFLAWRFREFWRTRRLLAGGLAFLLTFIVVRAASFHHMDALLKSPLAGMRLNWILELSGIGLIGAAAVMDWVKSRRDRH
jgi:hypothetical protein